MKKHTLALAVLFAATSLSTAWAANPPHVVKPEAPSTNVGTNVETNVSTNVPGTNVPEENMGVFGGEDGPPPPPPPPPAPCPGCTGSERGAVNSSSALVKAAVELEDAQVNFNKALKDLLADPNNQDKKERLMTLASSVNDKIGAVKRMSDRMQKDIAKYLASDPTEAVKQMQDQVRSSKTKMPPKTQEGLMDELRARLQKKS